jgi:hypothetical protein
MKSCEPKHGSILVRGRVALGIKPRWNSHLVYLLTWPLVGCASFCKSKTFACWATLECFFWSLFGNPEIPDLISNPHILHSFAFLLLCTVLWQNYILMKFTSLLLWICTLSAELEAGETHSAKLPDLTWNSCSWISNGPSMLPGKCSITP